MEDNHPRNRRILCGILVIISIALFTMVYYTICMASGGTFKYCICTKYSYKSDGIYDCYTTQIDNKIYKCIVETGYFLCKYKTNSCWKGCTYIESNTTRHDIPTCSLPIVDRCYVENGTCCVQRVYK